MHHDTLGASNVFQGEETGIIPTLILCQSLGWLMHSHIRLLLLLSPPHKPFQFCFTVDADLFTNMYFFSKPTFWNFIYLHEYDLDAPLR